MLHKLTGFLLMLCLSATGCYPGKDHIETPASFRERERHLFGIELRPAAVLLLNEVEELYHQRIVERDNSNSATKSGIGDAGSQVSTDGAPIISINTFQGKNEDSIVHELFHLKLFSLGFSTAPAIRLGTEGRNFDTSPMVHAALAFVYDPLQHSLFFPEMRKMGFDPDSDQRQTVLKAIREREIEGIEGLSESDKDRLRAMYYFQFSMHFTDSKLLSDLKGLYIKKWTRSLAMAEAMINEVRKNSNYTPESILNIYIYCLNILYKGERSYLFDQWVPRTKITRVAVINCTNN